MNEEEIIDGLKTICYCKGIPKKIFKRHMAAGVKTLAGLRLATGAGSGSCRGRRCTPRILELLAQGRNTELLDQASSVPPKDLRH
ncbi:MAG: (2Fe-2S)-binding protein [Desulfuromonadales bacterium]|jgi:NAD(P)H-nitrite reductase large subunit